MSRELGVTKIKLQELNNYKSSSLFSSEEQAVLRYADAVTSTPTEIPDEIFQPLCEYFDDSQIVELYNAIHGRITELVLTMPLEWNLKDIQRVHSVRYLLPAIS